MIAPARRPNFGNAQISFILPPGAVFVPVSPYEVLTKELTRIYIRRARRDHDERAELQTCEMILDDCLGHFPQWARRLAWIQVQRIRKAQLRRVLNGRIFH